MDDIKFCERCGTPIAVKGKCSDMRFIRVKYCKPCAAERNKETSRERSRLYRIRNKRGSTYKFLISKKQCERLDLYEQENQMLREQLVRLQRQLIEV